MIRLAAILLAAASLAACSGWDAYKHPTSGLRWMGDATVAGARDGTALGGPAVRFRVGGELSAQERTYEGNLVEDGAGDWLIGSWGGLEVSAAVLTGAVAGDRIGTLGVFGIRPWLSRRQSGWFLRNERFSVLGVLIPDAGVAVGLGAGTHFQLGWQLPLGDRDLQIAPGVSWIAPGHDQRLLGTIALRVPM